MTSLNKINDIKYNVQFIYPNALEELKLKLNKTEEEINKEGIFIDKLPKKEKLDDYYSMLYLNPTTREAWYEYTRKDDLSDIATLNEDNIRLKQENLRLGQENTQRQLEIIKLGQLVTELQLKLTAISPK